MVGVFDSGIGGLTLLHELKRTLPKEDFLYYADTKNVPYSYKSPEEIKTFVENAVLTFMRYGCKAIVLACNTATNVTVDYLRSKYDFPIVAIQPAIKVAFDNNKENKRILACATPVTLTSDRFELLINSLDINHLVDRLPLPKLVEFAENEQFDGPEVLQYLREEFSKLDITGYQYIVLGCTHFTYFEALIQQHYPNLIAVDGNQGTARHFKNVLEKADLLSDSGSGHVKFIESGEESVHQDRFLRYLNRMG